MDTTPTNIALSTERLLLRDFTENDWVTTHVYASDPEVVRHMDWGPNTPVDTKEFIRRALQRQKEIPRVSYDFAVLLRQEALHIGGCGIYLRSLAAREANMGYTFRRDFWGQGFATEAAKAIEEFGFKQLGMHRIWATAAPANVASQKVLLKLGMKYEGTLRQNLFVRGAWRDSALFSILEDEWLPHPIQELS